MQFYRHSTMRHENAGWFDSCKTGSYTFRPQLVNDTNTCKNGPRSHPDIPRWAASTLITHPQKKGKDGSLCLTRRTTRLPHRTRTGGRTCTRPSTRWALTPHCVALFPSTSLRRHKRLHVLRRWIPRLDLAAVDPRRRVQLSGAGDELRVDAGLRYVVDFSTFSNSRGASGGLPDLSSAQGAVRFEEPSCALFRACNPWTRPWWYSEGWERDLAFPF